MHTRWRFLLGCTLGALFGFVLYAWEARRFSGSSFSALDLFLHPAPIGLLFAALISAVAIGRALTPRWLPGVAVVCVAPAGWECLQTAKDLPLFIRIIGFPAVLLCGGTLGAVAVAISMLVRPAPVPPPPAGPPTARVVDAG